MPLRSRSQASSILSVQLTHETDFLLARQRAKQIAALMGFEMQDQTRIATALSEIARNAFEYGRDGRAEFLLENTLDGGSALRMEITDKGPGIPHLERIWAGVYTSKTGMGLGLLGARRLMDTLEVQTSAEGTRVTLVKALPHAGIAPAPSELAAMLSKAEATPVHALRDQNLELLSTLGELRARENDLKTLNEELEETNRGVMVLYAELADKAQAVQEASEMKTRFLSGVTHELRTPLNSIVSLSRLMLAHVDGPLNPEQEKQVNFILRSAQNLGEMVSDLLDLAKIEAGRATTNLSRFSVADLYGGLRGMFRPLATNPEVRLSFEIPEEPLLLWTDEGKVAQILRNFISNALKFTEHGSIVVSTQVIDGVSIRFSVADTGPGILAEDRELVMQEWGQVPGSVPQGQARGSGLGLPLSKRLAEMLGGSLDFVSEYGSGSTFSVTLPALQQAEDAPTAPDSILLCDDDEVARYLLRRQLGSLTTTPIEEAGSGSAALEAIRLALPRLLFLDMMMPGQGGTEVLRQLRSETRTRTLPVVLYTGKLLTAEERQMLEELDVAVLPKRPEGAGKASDPDEHKMRLERILMEHGLSNLHLEPGR